MSETATKTPIRLSDQRPPAVVRARYDAAEPDRSNDRTYANADALAPNSLNHPDTRARLRNRARYEVRNNSLAKGIVQTLANDVVGRGPRLQLPSDQYSPDVQRVEASFKAWAREVHLAEKLRLLRMARAESGEAFLVLTNNPGLKHPVKIGLRAIESDLVETPWDFIEDASVVDGIRYDDAGNVEGYYIRRAHPGDVYGADVTAAISPFDAYDFVPARSVVHYYKPDRPGQARGIPDLTPALPLFTQLRRWTRATLEAAETSANFAMAIYTDAAGLEPTELDPLDTVDLERGSAVTLPAGWKLSQMRGEHPATTHDMFWRQIVNEMARCLNMPFNIAAGNSAGYNYASGRLDHQMYFKAIRIDQAELAEHALDAILAPWLREFDLETGLLPARMQNVSVAELAPTWFWDGFEHVDPAKEANAQAQRLSSNTTTLAAEYAKDGRDWETELRQRAREKALMQELGLNEPEAAPAANPDEDEDEG